MNRDIRAIIEEGAIIAEGVQVGPYAIIGKDVTIGEGTTIGSGVILEGRVHIGSKCMIGHHTVIGTPPQDLSYQGEETEVWIGDETVIREFSTIHRATGKGNETRSCIRLFLRSGQYSKDAYFRRDPENRRYLFQ
jgi:UDP-N-acetylglucosamine acyltransferase